MRIGEAAAYLGMSIDGVRRAANKGRLPCTMSVSGQRIFRKEDLDWYIGRAKSVESKTERVEALYCRVSGTTGQESSLLSQEEALRETSSGRIYKVYKDRASGLRENRRALSRLLVDAEYGYFTVVRVTHADRLARFGLAWLTRYFNAHGVQVEILHERGDLSLQDELLADFMALLASFSGRFYKMRSTANQKKLLAEAEKQLNDRSANAT